MAPPAFAGFAGSDAAVGTLASSGAHEATLDWRVCKANAAAHALSAAKSGGACALPRVATVPAIGARVEECRWRWWHCCCAVADDGVRERDCRVLLVLTDLLPLPLEVIEPRVDFAELLVDVGVGREEGEARVEHGGEHFERLRRGFRARSALSRLL